MHENRQCPNCACRVYIGAIKTLTVLTHFLLRIAFQFRNRIKWSSNRPMLLSSASPSKVAALHKWIELISDPDADIARELGNNFIRCV